MNAPAKLKSSSNGQRPLFHPGQVLSDTALSGIATFARLGLAAESQRHGWGIIYGLFPSADTNSDSLTISRGMVADQDGRLFVLDHSPTIKLTELLSMADQSDAAANAEPSEFDLWLSIGFEAVGPKLPFRKIGVEPGFAPVVTPATFDEKRPSRQSLIASLELRGVGRLQKCLDEESGIVEAFKTDFNRGAMNWNSNTPYQEALDTIRACHANALAKLCGGDQAKYDGIPLGRVAVTNSANGLQIIRVDCGVARREQAPPLLPSKPDHINSAALFDLKRDEAAAWLARNGFPRWTVQSLTDDGVQQQMNDDQAFRCWDVELRAGTTAMLYTDQRGRIALVKQGPKIEDEFNELLRQIACLRDKVESLRSKLAGLALVLLIVGAVVFYLLLLK